MTDLVRPEMIEPILTTGASARIDADVVPQFAVGDTVVARNLNPHSHTRLPRYVRGHVGVIEHLHGCHVFPDSNALGKGEEPHWLYTVTFAGTDLWPDAPDRRLKVSVDAWEPYLEAIDAA